MFSILRLLLAVPVAFYLMRQVRKPAKFVGRPFAWIMNYSHSSLTDWGMEHVRIEKDFSILDVGCGGGRTIQKLAARAPEGRVFGVDYASGSVAASRAKNAKLIRAGRVDIREASVSRLPFPESAFDLVTAIETQYYWPNLLEDMREILRVLKPGGTLVVVAESYKNGSRNSVLGPAMKVLGAASLSVPEQRELFSSAGYADIALFEQPRKGWLCAIGKKPRKNNALPKTEI
jgi:SAM-dependent methyltransferase